MINYYKKYKKKAMIVEIVEEIVQQTACPDQLLQLNYPLLILPNHPSFLLILPNQTSSLVLILPNQTPRRLTSSPVLLYIWPSPAGWPFSFT